ncbi:MAG: hypothetical protein ACLUI3_03890 [Christensenellales bacterium]
MTLSQRLTSSAANLCMRGGASRLSQAEIRMSGDFLFRLSEGPFLLNGLSVATLQEAFLVVFEHELCTRRKTRSSVQPAILPASSARPRAVYTTIAPQFRRGSRSSLKASAAGLLLLPGQQSGGIVTYVGKTATVMVEDRSGAYEIGRKRATANTASRSSI